MKTMMTLIDRLLRGDDATDHSITPARILGVAMIMGLIYGACMGAFSIRTNGFDGLPQLLASTIKFPLLFVLTLAVTFPSLYVFSALLGSKLTRGHTLRSLTTSILVILTVAASLGPILGFFTASTESYKFILLLNIFLVATAVFTGSAFLLSRLRSLLIETTPPSPEQPTEASQVETKHAAAQQETTQPDDEQQQAEIQDPLPGTLRTQSYLESRRHAQAHIRTKPRDRGLAIFRVWIVVFAIVAGQMSWVLRPFIGSPDQPFSFFRQTEGNIFIAISRLLTGW